MNYQPGLTLAVIVKDEAKLLEELLSHHRDLYDEAVVVDTGSSDNSFQIAQEAGARAFRYEWDDDFAAARNHGLNHINTSRVLHLDCDERLDPDTFASIKSVTNNMANCCFELPVNNYTSTVQGGDWCAVRPEDLPWCHNALGYLRTHPVRIFPNLPTMRYEGVIHENLLTGINKSGLKVSRGTQIIHHTGLLLPEGQARRDILYTRLLEKKVSQSPDDLNGLTEYAKILISRGDILEAEKLLVGGLVSESFVGENVRANLLLIEILVRLGKLDLAIQRITPTIHHHPNHLLCWVQASALYIAQGDLKKARIYLEQGLKLFPDSTVLRQLEAKV